MKRALVLTNHLSSWGGSEVLALEVSEVLKETHNVTLVSNVISKDIESHSKARHFTITDNPSRIDLREYDFIWSQHYVAPLCRGFRELDEFAGSFNSVHLSPYEPFELAALSYSHRIGANIIGNSLETIKKIESFFLDNVNIYNLNNATLPSFSVGNSGIDQNIVTPRSIMLVSNHIPTELHLAVEILQSKGLKVAKFGFGQKNYKRIGKDDIEKHDVIITIGKTAQYGILAKRPVYCYDRFGGPGYIVLENAQTALDYNFSGRCCNRKLSAEDISNEILSGFFRAAQNTELLYEKYKRCFDLREFVKFLSSKNTTLNTNSVDPYPIIETAKLIRRLYAKPKPSQGNRLINKLRSYKCFFE